MKYKSLYTDGFIEGKLRKDNLQKRWVAYTIEDEDGNFNMNNIVYAPISWLEKKVGKILRLELNKGMYLVRVLDQSIKESLHKWETDADFREKVRNIALIRAGYFPKEKTTNKKR